MEKKEKMDIEMEAEKEITECKDKRKKKESEEVMNGFNGLSKAIRDFWEEGRNAPSGFLSTLSTIRSIKSMYKDTDE